MWKVGGGGGRTWGGGADRGAKGPVGSRGADRGAEGPLWGRRGRYARQRSQIFRIIEH